MRITFLTLALLFSATLAAATQNTQPPSMIPMEQLLAVREQLIKSLVGHGGVLGVSICGSENELFPDGGTNWLTVYIMKDAPLPEIPTDLTELVPVVIVRKRGTGEYK